MHHMLPRAIVHRLNVAGKLWQRRLQQWSIARGSAPGNGLKGMAGAHSVGNFAFAEKASAAQ